MNLAYQAALPLVNLTNPSPVDVRAEGRRRPQLLGRRPVRVRGDHAGVDPGLDRCRRLLHDQRRADTRPPVQAAGGGKQFPAERHGAAAELFQHDLPDRDHSSVRAAIPRARPPRSSRTLPMPRMWPIPTSPRSRRSTCADDLSRFYQRLAHDFHHCWPTATSDGAPDCPGSAAHDARGHHRLCQRHPGNAHRSVPGRLQRGHAHSGHHRLGRQPLRGQPGRQVHVRDRRRAAPPTTRAVSPRRRTSRSPATSPGPAAGVSLSAQGGKAQASTSASSEARHHDPGSGEYSIEAWVGARQRHADQRLDRELLGQQHHAQRHARPGCRAVPGLRAQQYHQHRRHAAADHDHGQRRRAGGPAARRAHLRPGQRPEALRQRRLHRRRGSLQGRLARQLGQHFRAGARQRGHRPAAVAGHDQVRRHL